MKSVFRVIKYKYKSLIFFSDVINRVIEASIVALVKRCDYKGRLFDEVAEVLISQTDDVSLKVNYFRNT